MPGSSYTPVAVIGMACRLPGGIDSPDGLWTTLLEAKDQVSTVPVDRWDAEDYYDPQPGVPGRSVSKWGGFLDDIAGFDAEFFGVGGAEATAIDPQHRLLLETAWEAIEHAGIDPKTLTGTRAGVFVGMTHGDYQLLAADANVIEGPYGFTGTNYSMASGRIAYALGASGPAYTVDSACSSGLLTVHLACRSLHDGESDTALAGGVSLMLEPRKMVSGSAQGMLSATGRCRAFDAEADGFVSAEGSAMVMLKRLADAQRDGDRILAVIRGSAANQDGRTVNIATPSVPAQQQVYRAALDAAGVDPRGVGMIEAHGTGTPVGDPIEFESLAGVYGTAGPCALGSVKTNVGHSQSAAGTVGLIKAVLSVGHGVVPANLHFTGLPKELQAVQTGLFVPQRTTDWPVADTEPRRAAVSAYGLSGTNVHAVIEQAPQPSPAPEPRTDTGPALFAVSASSPEALQRSADRLAHWVAGPFGDTGATLPELAHTLACRRGHRRVRVAVTARTRAELVGSLRSVAELPHPAAVGTDDRGPVWVFSGHGSQWPGMGTALLRTEPEFARAIVELEPLIAAEAGFSVTEMLTGAGQVSAMDRVQPAVFAVQIGLAAALRSRGVRPAAVIGHSMGEVAAAVVSGGLSLHDGVRVICRRSALMASIAGSGAMASVELPAAQVLSELAARGIADVTLAVVASPGSTVVGGNRDSVRELLTDWAARDIAAAEVAVEVASHSPEVEPILDDLIEALAELSPGEPHCDYYSSTLYDPRDPADLDAYYWADNLRHTVRFSAAVQAALEDGHRVFAELSPHPLLTHAVDQTADALEVPVATVAAIRRDREAVDGLLPMVGDLYAAGGAVDFAALAADGPVLDAPLPAWTHQHLMVERDKAGAAGPSVAAHPLLGAHVRLAEEPERHVWQGDLGTDAQPWLADHQVHTAAALPAAAYCEMALNAAAAVHGPGAVVTDIAFEQLLLLDPDTTVSSTATATVDGASAFEIETTEDGTRIRRSAARLAPATGDRPPAQDIAGLRRAHPKAIDGDALRGWFAERGIDYGPAFAGLAVAHTGAGPTVFAEVSVPGPLRSAQRGYLIHPALLDACFQTVGAHPDLQADLTGMLALPLAAARLRVFTDTRAARYCLARINRLELTEIDADIEILDEHGATLATVEGLRMGTGVSAGSRRDRTLDDRLLSIDWTAAPAPEPAAAPPGRWLLIAATPAAAGRAATLAAELGHRGASTQLLSGAEAVAGERFAGIAVLTAASTDPDAPVAGLEPVRRLVSILAAVADTPGEHRVVLVTEGAQQVLPGEPVDLSQGGLRGMVRAFAMEQPDTAVAQIDLDTGTDSAKVADQLLSGGTEDESAWRDGHWYVARLRPTPLRPEDRRTVRADHRDDGLRVEVRTPGDLESVELVAFDRRPPGPGQIEVAVAASTLNFADVLVAHGRYPSFEGQLPRLGADFSGVVTALGAGVTNHRVGDRVAGITGAGAWANYLTADANLAVPLDDSITDAAAAAVPSAHATAWYCLHELARIRRGDKVLIHSATGGVGQAAVAIARAAGAEIFATAGSPARRDVLREQGIEHVYDSRSTAFAEQIRTDTAGYGVDIVLNSLPGAAQRAGLELLSFGGKFLEIGKRDIYGDTRLGLLPFRRNLSFYAVDLALLTLTDPGTVAGVLSTVYRNIADGVLPAPATTEYPLADAASALRTMAAAGHTGKLVLTVPRTGASEVVLPPEHVPVYRPDGSYLITGGLGGLGLYLAARLAAAGCGRIVLNGRSAPTPEAEAVLAEIRATGVQVVVVRGDIAAAGTAERLVEAATATGLPVRGVLHAAAVIEDATIGNITDELLERDWGAKVYGAWRLQHATADAPLDWFCVFSSAAAMVGSPGQGGYAAANSWLDSFTRWRRTRGLPATAIAWGAWAQIGRGQQLARDAAAMAIAPEDGAHAFEAVLRSNRAYTGYAPIAGTSWIAAFARTSKFAEAFAALGAAKPGTSALRAELRELPPQDWPARLRRLITEQIALILRRSVEPDRPLSECGLDSLGSLEIRTRIEKQTGVRVAGTAITTVRELADHLVGAIAAADDAAGSGAAWSR
ncbi:sulfolipid-1 biosynthesis phthioceranic/hydroxyphthioceranic acid synthase [Mycolicibacterium fallax]|uniref:Polyketide synthase n=1 Tax=Mycolicibacterium fallax TaxID=1793 RepID=A0A1X1R7Q3_MYCFA|nr:type I polyketide synthase [Mycolicibacterium fallax]ORV00828.1 polyketide synthase [Mycolicibacterium fallax]BBY97201.1 mycocerosic acid synthase-like polyketide synthase [Mycolicibacterium fallax]